MPKYFHEWIKHWIKALRKRDFHFACVFHNCEQAQLRSVVVETAQAVMDARGHDPEVRVRVAALIGSLDDRLPDERVLQELEALKARGPTFQLSLITLRRGPSRLFPAGRIAPEMLAW